MPKTVTSIVATLCLISSSSPLTIACMGSEFNSVHFHSGEPDFGTLPRRGILGDGDDRPNSDDYSGGERFGVELSKDREGRSSNRTHMLEAAENALRAGKWKQAIDGYRRAEKEYGRRDVSADRIRLAIELSRLNRSDKAVLDSVHDYTRALNVYYPDMANSETILNRLTTSPVPLIRDFATYQLGCSIASTDRPAAAKLFEKYLRSFPQGHCREETLIMLARVNILTKDANQHLLDAGTRALSRLNREFPRTRFQRAAIGLRGRVLYLTGRPKEALNCYYSVGDMASVEIVASEMGNAAPDDLKARLLAGYLRRLASSRYYSVYEDTLGHIRSIRSKFTPADAKTFSKMLARDMSLPAPYFYVRLYHNPEVDKELPKIARKADDVARANSSTVLPPLVQTRLAEIFYQIADYKRAMTWAETAIQSVKQGRRSPFNDAQNDEVIPRSVYVRSACLHHLKRYDEAISGFNSILSDFANSPLRRSVREELALLYERKGDLASALDEYFALGYQYDIAYMLDVRMTTKQVEQYASRHFAGKYSHNARHYYASANLPKESNLSELLSYTLGIRHLRDENLERAADWLRRVPRQLYAKMHEERQGEGSCPDPLTAAREILALKKQIKDAKTRNSKAEAMYSYATYYYKHGTLLLYNPMLWEYGRALNFAYYWNKSAATELDNQAVQEHMHNHEVYARTMVLCRQIAKLYPDSPTAPRALYRAACASNRLVRLNAWWHKGDKSHDHEEEASRLMSRVAKRYPKSPLSHAAAKFARVFRGEVVD